MIDNELKQLTNRKRRHQNRVKAYEKYLINNAYGTDIETARAKVQFKLGTGRVNVTDISLVPKEFVKVQYTEDKIAIKKLLKQKIPVAGCELIFDKKVNIK